MSGIDERDWSLARIVAQGLCEPCSSPLEVVRHLGCVQGQDLPGALLSIALRTRSQSVLEVVEAFNRGELVRNWTMRGTLHVVAAADEPWVLGLTGPRMASGQAARHRQLGIDEALVCAAESVAVTLLDERGRLSRGELFEAWQERSLLQGVAQRGVHLLSLLCRRLVLRLGPIRTLDRPSGGWEQLVVAGPAAVDPATAEHLPDWAVAYFASHGPAHERDLARWTGLALTPIRRALAGELPLSGFELDGVRHWHAPALAERLERHREAAARMLLLPGFDELVLGYQDRSPIVPVALAEAVVPGNNGVFKNTIVDHGRVVGTWRRPSATRRAPRPRPQAQWLVAPSARQLRDFDRAAEALPHVAVPE